MTRTTKTTQQHLLSVHENRYDSKTRFFVLSTMTQTHFIPTHFVLIKQF